ncbi:MAG TPA: SRPBCC family protein [Acidimicrobiales bacterium]|nr:SRPBCC family protein [Acidimicrobiales bacterium]
MKRTASGLNRHRGALASASVAAMAALGVLVAARRKRGSPLAASATTTIARPADEVYRSWRNFESLPDFMDHLKSVKDIDGRRSHWVAHGPAGTTVEWEAEVVEDVVGEVIAWRSVEGADVDNAGSVRFSPAPRGQGTEVTVELDYAVPGGVLGSSMAKLLGEEPSQQLKDDLRRFKQVLEAGEVVRSDGTPEGIRTLGQLRQRHAQPTG